VNGWVYTLHLHTPLGRGGRNGAVHYTGWASEWGLLDRLAQHAAGNGARMMAYCATAGIRWHVGHLCRGDRNLERRLKGHGAARRCWTCRYGKDAEQCQSTSVT
jgi:hypothetical protein